MLDASPPFLVMQLSNINLASRGIRF
uniref:Uncharacterized protein n=1 Tax=Arundo donax TaxID=35708 RepID=A0A0A9BDG9_ARUDO